MQDPVSHPGESAFESFVIGALPAAESDAFVAHVSACDACAKRLAVEAEVELEMSEVHAAAKAAAVTASKRATSAPSAVVRLDRGRRGMIWGGASALSLAAAVVLFVLSPGAREEALPATMTVSTARPSEPIPLTVCPDGTDQEKCIEDAHRHGRFVSYPPWASTPPLGGGRAGHGPSGSPFPVQM